jgi:hypothetical protein
MKLIKGNKAEEGGLGWPYIIALIIGALVILFIIVVALVTKGKFSEFFDVIRGAA